MQKIVCKNCGCSKQVENYLTLNLADFKCEICTKSGIDNFRVIDGNGKMIQYAEAKKAEHDRQKEYKNRRESQMGGKNDMVQMWEYKIVDCDPERLCGDWEQKRTKMEAIMNQYGVLGWELVQENNYTAIFKRPKLN